MILFSGFTWCETSTWTWGSHWGTRAPSETWKLRRRRGSKQSQWPQTRHMLMRICLTVVYIKKVVYVHWKSIMGQPIFRKSQRAIWSRSAIWRDISEKSVMLEMNIQGCRKHMQTRSCCVFMQIVWFHQNIPYGFSYRTFPIDYPLNSGLANSKNKSSCRIPIIIPMEMVIWRIC